ncbi:MAG: HAMP domain-containing histidine kinase [Cyanobacteria bacterium]|nr:HAMP domain-containing histidine kinase [Cyanobacteriota bacterium]
MKIFQKLLILLAVPLLVDILLVVTLLEQTGRIERETEHVQTTKELLQGVFLFQNACQDAVSRVVMITELQNVDEMENFTRALNMLPVLSKKIKHVARKARILDSPQIRGLQAISIKVRSTLKEMKQQLKSKDHVYTPLESHRLNEDVIQLCVALDEALGLTKSLVSWQSQEEHQSVKRQERMREDFNIILLYGLSLNVVIGIVMAVWINGSITTRLRAIMQNAERIALDMPLLNSVSGHDEISQIDTALHRASSSVVAARQREREIELLREDLFAVVSDDLRYPLATVKTSLELLLGQDMLPAKAQRSIQLADTNAGRAFQLIDDFLDLRSLDKKQFRLELQMVEASHMVSQSVDTVIDQAKAKKQNIEVNLQPVYVLADEVNLRRVVTNLLTNALKFTPVNGVVSVDLITEADTGSARFEIHDEGPGVPDEFKSYIFDSFRQLPGQDRARGTGLGLSICRLIVEQHGGEIGVMDRSPGGSTFWFTIPLYSERDL